jgi:hypothetical protein
MAKRDHIITADDLRAYLSTRDNFALERFVYHKTRKLGFSAAHGGTYTDPVTKKPRQFDMRASFQHEGCRVDLAIECKSLQPTYPLLLSRVPRATTENFHQLISYDIATASAAVPISPFGDYAKAVLHAGSHSIYHAGEFVAKNVTQVGRDDKGNLRSGDEGVYDKWSQALASADELVAFAENGYRTKKLLTFVVPVLVVSDKTLWVVDYSEDGRETKDPVQVDESVLFVGREYGGSMQKISYTISHLHILTKSRVSAFFDQFKDTEFWQRIFHSKSDPLI